MKRILTVAALVVGGVGVNLLTRPPAPQAQRATEVLPDTPIARGRVVYERWGCPACHGDMGAGGFDNHNSETNGKVPGVTFVAEGYSKGELRKYMLGPHAITGKKDPKGPVPPFRMPPFTGQMTAVEASDLVDYMFSLLPKEK